MDEYDDYYNQKLNFINAAKMKRCELQWQYFCSVVTVQPYPTFFLLLYEIKFGSLISCFTFKAPAKIFVELNYYVLLDY